MAECGINPPVFGDWEVFNRLHGDPYNGVPMRRHKNTCNILWVDGHVSGIDSIYRGLEKAAWRVVCTPKTCAEFSPVRGTIRRARLLITGISGYGTSQPDPVNCWAGRDLRWRPRMSSAQTAARSGTFPFLRCSGEGKQWPGGRPEGRPINGRACAACFSAEHRARRGATAKRDFRRRHL